MSFDEKRREIIEQVFDNYDFEPDVVAEVNGWQHSTPDEYHRTIFFENGDLPSRFAIFSVKFKRGSTEVEYAGT